MLRKVIIFLLLLCPLTLLTADVNTVLDGIYESETAPLLESTWLILRGADKLEESSVPTDAQSYLDEKAWEGSDLTAGRMALMLMENYPIPRGFLSRLTKTPYYALKDLKQLRILPGELGVQSTITGFDLVNSLSVVMEANQ